MRNERILVIDDEPTVATLLGRRLEQEGFTCQLAHSADEALQYLREGSFAAALVDIRMPGKGGITLLGEMKALDPDLAAIMVTAIKDRESAVKSMKLGAEDYIVKPFDLDEVVISLRRALDKRRLTLENRAYHEELERLVAERTCDLEQRNRELTALNALVTALGRSLDLREILNEAADKVMEIMQMDVAQYYVRGGGGGGGGQIMLLIFLLDEKSGDLILHLHRGLDDKSARRLSRVFPRGGLLHSVLEQGKPVACPLPEEGALAGVAPPLAAGTLIGVPLIATERVRGVMVILGQEGRIFGPEEMNLLDTIGRQVAVAIENAKLYEETIKEKERTETILAEAFAGIMVVDPRMRIVSLNPGAEAITGYASQEVLDKRLPEVFGPELWGEESPLYKAMATGERVAPVEVTLVGKEGARDILLAVAPLHEGCLLSFADITRLKEVDRLKTNIVANVSHDLRTPLACIRAYTQLLMENLDEGDADLRQRFLGVIDQETQHLADLITDLLNVARLESGRFEPHKEDISLRDVAEKTLARFQIQAQQRGIQLLLDAPSDLPHLLVDREMMGILFKNLISNTIKFSTHGGEVKVSLRADDEQQTLTVTDQGIGIGPEDLPHIFEKFHIVVKLCA